MFVFQLTGKPLNQFPCEVEDPGLLVGNIELLTEQATFQQADAVQQCHFTLFHHLLFVF